MQEFHVVIESKHFLSFRLISKNLKTKIYKIIILTVVLSGYERLTLTLRKECRSRVFENRIRRRIFGSNWDANGSREDFTMRKSIVFTVQIMQLED